LDDTGFYNKLDDASSEALSCTMTIDDVECNSCTFMDSDGPTFFMPSVSTRYDCRNTIIGSNGKGPLLPGYLTNEYAQTDGIFKTTTIDYFIYENLQSCEGGCNICGEDNYDGNDDEGMITLIDQTFENPLNGKFQTCVDAQIKFRSKTGVSNEDCQSLRDSASVSCGCKSTTDTMAATTTTTTTNVDGTSVGVGVVDNGEEDQGTTTNNGGEVDIPTTAVNAGVFQTLVVALTTAGLVDAISEPNGPFTVFAPTDDAFASLPNGLVACLLQPDNKSVLSNILLYHVASGKFLSTELTNGMEIQTLLENQIVTIGDFQVNDSPVIDVDISASNGVIHVIDQVLVPSDVNVPAFLETCDTTVGTAVVSSSGIDDDDDDDDDDDATGNDGVVDIPTTAINAGVFQTLVAALDAADLVSALSKPNGPFTVFAPSDDAFDALPNGLVTCLLLGKNKQTLTNLLLYHVANGKVLSTDLSNNQIIPTLLSDENVEVSIKSGKVKINDSKVLKPDVIASNGVIHVIKDVLVPSSFDVPTFLGTSCSDDGGDDNTNGGGDDSFFDDDDDDDDNIIVAEQLEYTATSNNGNSMMSDSDSNSSGGSDNGRHTTTNSLVTTMFAVTSSLIALIQLIS